MDIKSCFESGDYLEVVGKRSELVSQEDRLMLGISLYKLGRKREALDVLASLEDELEVLAKGLFSLAKLRQELGDPNGARRSVERYLAFYPDDDDALDLFDEAQEVDEFVSEGTPELGMIYAQQGHYEQALDIFAKAIRDGADESLKVQAVKTQDMYIVKTLESWLERLRG